MRPELGGLERFVFSPSIFINNFCQLKKKKKIITSSISGKDANNLRCEWGIYIFKNSITKMSFLISPLLSNNKQLSLASYLLKNVIIFWASGSFLVCSAIWRVSYTSSNALPLLERGTSSGTTSTREREGENRACLAGPASSRTWTNRWAKENARQQPNCLLWFLRRKRSNGRRHHDTAIQHFSSFLSKCVRQHQKESLNLYPARICTWPRIL